MMVPIRKLGCPLPPGDPPPMPGTPPPSPASAADRSADALPPGTRLGEFEILSVLGAGGFGMVYRAFDHSLLRPVAIKEYLPAALAHRTGDQSLWVRSSSDEPSFQAGLASFVEEARLLAQFDHPSLVKVFRFWEAHQTAYMVMPLYEGMTLKQARARMVAPPPEAWLRQVLWAVLSALRELHGAHTLHRDISPDNIFLQDCGPPVLLDLGAARKAMDSSIHRRHAPATVLTASYAPIEQYPSSDGELAQGPWTDLYALGAVVHGCLSNASPLPATLRAVRDRLAPFPQVARAVRREFGTGYSPAFVAAVSQALALRPEERPESIEAFLRAMEMTEPPERAEPFDFRAALGAAWSGHAAGPAEGGMREASTSEAPPPLAGATFPVPSPLADPSTALPARLSAPQVPRQEAVPSWVSDDIGGAPGGRHHPGSLRAAWPTLVGRPSTGAEPMLAIPPQTLVPRGRRAQAHRRRGAVAPWMFAGAAALLVAGTGGAWWQLQSQLAALPAGAGWSAPVAALAPADPSSSFLRIAEEGGPRPSRSTSVHAAHGERAPQVRPASRPGTAFAQRVSAARPVDGPSAVPAAPRRPAAAPAAQHRSRAFLDGPGPQEVCAGTGFLARPMCVHRECQKAAQAAHPVCVQTRRQHAEEGRRQRLLAPQ